MLAAVTATAVDCGRAAWPPCVGYPAGAGAGACIDAMARDEFSLVLQ
mgnify:CR=1 FL=1